MSKTVAYVGNFAFPDKNASGKRVLGNCLLLKYLGYTPICIGIGEIGELSYEGITCHNIKINNIDRVGGRGSATVTDILRKYNSVQSLTAVILYGALFTQKENIKIIRWCKRNQIRVFYDQVDWLELNWHNPLRALVRAYNHFLMNHLVIPRCDGVICISSYLSNYHSARGRKTVVIPPLSSGCTQRTVTRDDSEVLRFAYAGTSTDVSRPVNQWKDRLDLMFSAFAQVSQEKEVRPFHIDVFGLTKKQYIKMFPKAMRKNGEDVLRQLGQRVTFHGLVTNEVAAAGVAAADFTVLIRDKKRSTMAGFPTKVSESVSCGTPVICTDTSDLREFVFFGYNGFICENEQLKDIYRTVLQLADEQLFQMKRNCSKNSFYYKNFLAEMKSFLGKQDEFLQENY